MFQPEFVQHRGRQVLRLDYSGLSLAEAVPAMRRAAEVIASQPPKSVLVLTCWTTPLSHESLRLIRHHLTLNGPFTRASAIVIPHSVVIPLPLRKKVMVGIPVGGHECLRVFEDEAQALVWLVTR